MYEYVGAVHIHSIYSDGTGKIDDIAKAAYDSRLDFIMMTDHNTLKPKSDGFEKWLNGVLVIVGYEVNDTDNKNHYLAFGIDEIIGSYQVLESGELGCKLSAKEYVKQIREKGGIGFIAHPDESRSHLPEHPPYPWLEKDTDDFTGIEVWNHMSEWIEGVDESNKLDRFLHPLKSIISPSAKTLERWDNSALKRHVTGIGGVDAHALKQNLLGFFEVEIFAYKVLFKSIRTHVLLEEEIKKNDKRTFEFSKKNILKALETGRCFFSNYYHGNAKGFRFYAEHKGRNFITGDVIDISEGNSILMKALLPKEAQIRLIHNGKPISQLQSMEAAWEIKLPGIYRVECWLNDKGWIFSNHIRVTNSK